MRREFERYRQKVEAEHSYLGKSLEQGQVERDGLRGEIGRVGEEMGRVREENGRLRAQVAGNKSRVS